MKRKVFSILLSLALCFSLLPTVAFADTHTHEGWTAWSTTDALPTEAGNYYLTVDVTLSAVQFYAWSAPAGVTRICLEGHKIDWYRSTSYNRNIMRVYSGSELHIYDKDDNSGKITGGAATGNMSNGSFFGRGGAVYVEGGTFYLHGGQITGNGATEGGGVYVDQNGSFYMSGGIISNNVADDSNWFRAAGVHIGSGGTFTMTGGIITGNNGGSIGPSSFARRWGVFVHPEGTFNVSGSPVITGNQGECNVLLGDGSKINVIGPLTENAQIGVTTWRRVSESENNPTRITSGLSGNGDLSNFVCDNGNWYREPPANNYLRLAGGDAEIYYAVTHNVTVTPGANMTKTSDSGAESQTGLTGAMTDVVYTADDGYYFPTDYSVSAVNGVSVTRNDYTQITVTGTPTADAAITLTAPTAKTKLDTPAASFAANGEKSGALTIPDAGTYTLAYKDSNGDDVPTNITQEGSQSWPIADIGPCTMTVTRVPNPSDEGESASKLNSDAQMITITKAAAPSVEKTDCTTESNNDGTITGVDTTMEYQADGASDWTAVTGTSVTGLVDGTYHVRVKAAGTALASDAADVTIAAYNAPITYSISVAPTSVALTAEEGYADLEISQDIVATSTGTGDVTIIVAGFKDTASNEQFGVINSGMTSTVYAKEGLTEGAYTAILVIEDVDGLAEAVEVPVTLTVSAAEEPETPEEPEVGFTVSFDANGGSGSMDDVTVVSGAAFKLPANGFTAPSGKRFKAWGVGSEEYAVGASYTVTTDTAIKALWENWPTSTGGGGGSSAPAVPVTPAEPEKPFPFEDVAANRWSRDAIRRMYEAGILYGVTETEFAPTRTLDRGMIVTMLYRMAGKPAAGTNSFADVNSGAYYANAVAWADANGIVSGYLDGSFRPNRDVSRQELVAILYRYAKLQGKGFEGLWAFPLEFSDSADVADFAYEAFCWMVMNGVISGREDGTLDPNGLATREEAAVIFSKFMDVMAE